MRYWIVFFMATDPKGDRYAFAAPYIGNEILWKYLFEDMQEDYNFKSLMVTGYTETTHQKLKVLFPQI